MFKQVFNENGFARILKDGCPAGFQFEMKLQYYRGAPLSIILDIEVWLDGVKTPRESLRVVNRGDVFTLVEMETAVDNRWEFGKWGAVQVLVPVDPAPGRHRLACTQTLRPSYMPWPIVVQAETEFEL
jgi:hypothetical protein